MLYALAFVPENDVVAVYNKLTKTTFFKDNAEELLDYFETTWIGSVTRRGQTFGLGLCNHYQTIVDGGRRTNNPIENWH